MVWGDISLTARIALVDINGGLFLKPHVTPFVPFICLDFVFRHIDARYKYEHKA